MAFDSNTPDSFEWFTAQSTVDAATITGHRRQAPVYPSPLLIAYTECID